MDITEWLKIPSDNFEVEMREHPSRLYYIGKLISRRKSEVERSKRICSHQYSAIKEELRLRCKKHGSKLSESRLEDKTNTDARYVEKQKLHENNIKDLDLLKYAYEAMLAKGEMLTNLSYAYRKELDYDIRKKAIKVANKKEN